MDGRNGIIGDTDARYKFTGKERDAETQYDYFGARYYDSRIGRWLSADPMAEKYPGCSPYEYAIDNPILIVDAKGDTIANVDQAKQNELYKQMKKADRKQYEEYQNSRTVYQFADVYNGWQIINEAREHIGLQYVYGGFDLAIGVDCSGFVEAVMQKLGMVNEDLEKLSTSNFFSVLGSQLERVDETTLLWGDVVRYGEHMGFYDPTPVKHPPEGHLHNANLLSARGTPDRTKRSLQRVHYGVMRSTDWFGTNPSFYRARY